MESARVKQWIVANRLTQQVVAERIGYLRSSVSRALDLVRRLSQRAGIQHEVQPYMLPPSILGRALEGRIALDISVLDDLKDAVATWLHEAAHVEYGTDDATAAHVDAVAQVAARVIVSYAAR